MKAIFKISALALLATALTVSCTREMDNMVREEAPVMLGGSRTFTLSIDNPATKVSIGEGANLGKTAWEAGDEILFHGKWCGAKDENVYSVVVTLAAEDISEDGKTAVITVPDFNKGSNGYEGDTGLSDIYAAYPASAVVPDNGENNWRSLTKYAESNLPIMVGFNLERDGTEFAFLNITGIITFGVQGGFDSFEFSGNNEETVAYDGFASKAYWRDYDGTPGLYFEPVNSGAPKKKLVAPIVAGGINYICIPGGAEFKAGFNFVFKKDGKIVKVAKSENALELPVNGIVELGDISAKLEDYIAPEESDHTPAAWAADAIDLSIAGLAAANCYVIDAPGVYMFPALKGNSDEKAGNVFGAEIVWETYNNAVEVVPNSIIAEVDYDNDNVYFKTPDALKPGNAVIAAKGNDDAILWSWHIWIPADAITTNAHNLYPQELMDRNLGALVAATPERIPVESYGLLYQWGRKDPFIGALDVDSYDFATRAGTALSASEGPITVAESIANPAMYAYGQWNTWTKEEDFTLWQNEVKTIYDPCPAGYRVPARDKSQPLFSGNLDALEGWSIDGDAHYFTVGNPAAVFPLSGYIDDWGPAEGVEHSGDRACIWTAYADGVTSARMLNVRADKGVYEQGGTAIARAGTVRCVKIDGWEEPQPPVDVKSTVAEITAQITSEDKNNPSEYEAELEGAVVTYVNGSSVYIEDNSGAILLYLKNSGLEKGDIISGPVSGTGYLYNGLPEITSLGDAYTKSTGGMVPTTYMTLPQLLADYDANLSRQIHLTDIIVSEGIHDGQRTGEVKDANGVAILVYAQLNNQGLVMEVGKKGDLICFPTVYKGTPQLAYWDNEFFLIDDDETPEWDFTPGEDYLSEDNLWAPLDPNDVMAFYYHCVGAEWNGTNTIAPVSDCDDLLYFDKSTYVVKYEAATTQDWQNQFALYPALNKAISMKADGKYKLQFILASNSDCNAFFKLVKYNPDKVVNENKPEGDCIWEWGRYALTAYDEPVVVESPVMTGVEAENIVLFFDFGANPANAEFYIKDIVFLAEEPADVPAGIVIDGDMSDWDEIEGSTNGNHTLKAFSDDDYIYIYSKRANTGRFAQIWGGAGYLYIQMNLDGDDTTGETLWGHGPFEFVGVIYPYAGSADAPAFNETPGDACMPEDATLANVICNGRVVEDGAEVEIRIPREDIPAIPSGTIVLSSWGNKDCDLATLECVL
ncbi:MAG: hypothetical protein J5669_03100 [Bacteroidales bacterium]|nr:hypothetical protein [Bacteroidales bacterium]